MLAFLMSRSVLSIVFLGRCSFLENFLNLPVPREPRLGRESVEAACALEAVRECIAQRSLSFLALLRTVFLLPVETDYTLECRLVYVLILEFFLTGN